MNVVILTASTMKKKINGIEFSGKCVTALDLQNSRVLRFVQNKDGAPMEPPYCDLYQPLEIHNINVIKDCPLNCQTENVLANYKAFNFLGKYGGTIHDLYDAFQKIDYGDSSFMLNGSDRLMDVTPFKHSLELIIVSELTIGGKNGVKKCSFRHNGIDFKFISITDPNFALQNSVVGDAILAVSIPAYDFDNKGYFKIVAAVFPIEKPWTKEEDEDLIYEHNKGWALPLMCAAHKRTEDEIKKRLSLLL